jgi:hypothetical protein
VAAVGHDVRVVDAVPHVYGRKAPRAVDD